MGFYDNRISDRFLDDFIMFNVKKTKIQTETTTTTKNEFLWMSLIRIHPLIKVNNDVRYVNRSNYDE